MTSKSRPSPLSTKSFTRYEPSTASPATSVRSRASTIASPIFERKSIEDERQDVFNKKQEEDEEELSPELNKTYTLPERFDELPVELISLTDRFVESLSSKAFTGPPTIDQISELFQEFYIRASSNISIHIASLRLKLNRDASPNRSVSGGKTRHLSIKQSTDSLRPPGGSGSQQMLTATEVTERRKQRKLLDYKKLMLEEAVERRACEMIYDKIWRHKSTLDEVQDEKLRSKTAALALVGVGLRDLGVEPGKNPDQTLEDIQEALAPAREGLIKMNDEHFPLGKLQHLTEAHKVIVDTLYTMHGSSSSADEILPTLIYTLISAPVEGINIISNLNFIQRFRSSSKIDGEAAYCMTNLEAAIGFLENVDLASLREDELPEGPKRVPSGQQTPSIEKTEAFPPFPATTPVPPTTSSEAAIAQKSAPTKDGLKATKAVAATKALPSPRHQRTLSDLLKPVQNVNESVKASAKEGLDNISNTLDNSLKFFFGRLKEQAADPLRSDDLTVPKTLDEARQLVSKPSTPILGEDGVIISETSSNAGDVITDSPDGLEKDKKIPSDDKLLGLFGNRRTVSTGTRDKSLDRESLRSNSSTKKVAFASNSSEPKVCATTPSQPIGNPLDAVKNFGGSLNPLGHVGNAFNAFGGSFKSFGRPAATPSPPQSNINAKKENVKTNLPAASAQVEEATQGEPQVAIFMDAPEKLASKIKSVPPPIKKFIDASSAADLQIRDVDRLLADYQRLAALLNELASQDLDETGSST